MATSKADAASHISDAVITTTTPVAADDDSAKESTSLHGDYLLSATDRITTETPALLSPAPVVEYRVYKRRWIGLGMLMIMNIVVSWGWLTFAPVSNLTQEWFRLESESPVNWLSTVILFYYVAATPSAPPTPPYPVG